MKNLKSFNTKTLDAIMDKISDSGKDSLTSWENEYLLSFGTPKQKEMDEELIKKEKGSDDMKRMGEYDPRKDDTDFYKDAGEELGVGQGMDDWIKNMSDEEYADNQTEILWDQLPEEEMTEFLESFNVNGDYHTKPWGKVDKEVKNLFMTFLKQKGYKK